jgi:hypothetical protein
MAAVGEAEVASALGADVATAAVLRGSRIVALTLDQQARPTAAVAHAVPAAIPA